MEYCNLGNSGLEVSRIGLGAIPFGTTLDDKISQRIVDMYHDAGGNLLDTANLYGGGERGTNTEMAAPRSGPWEGLSRASGTASSSRLRGSG